MLKLFQFPRAKGFPNFSPFCVKLETYLRMADIPYENVFTLNLAKNPKKLMPYVELDGQIIGDSTFIIDHLIKQFGDKVDNNLTTEQKAVSHAFKLLAEKHLVPVMIYFRWVYPGGWKQFREQIFAKAPKLIKIFIGNKLSKNVAKGLYAQGTGRFNIDELLYLAEKDFQALTDYLGEKEFFFGDKPSSLDAIVFSVFGGIVFTTIEIPLKDLALKFDNLYKHSERMFNMFYNDIK